LDDNLAEPRHLFHPIFFFSVAEPQITEEFLKFT
jgi:hypothetical protein